MCNIEFFGSAQRPPTPWFPAANAVVPRRRKAPMNAELIREKRIDA